MIATYLERAFARRMAEQLSNLARSNPGHRPSDCRADFG